MRHDKYLFSISESISIISFAVPSEPKTRTLQSVPIAVSVMLSLLVLSAQTSCVPMHEQTITQVIFKRLAKLFFRFMKIFLSLIGCSSIFCKKAGCESIWQPAFCLLSTISNCFITVLLQFPLQMDIQLLLTRSHMNHFRQIL